MQPPSPIIILGNYKFVIPTREKIGNIATKEITKE
jgi:hypothetical protein